MFFDKKESFLANVTVQNCLLRTVEGLPGFVTNIANILNQDPRFKDISKDDYHLIEGSPAIGKGIVAGSFSVDLDGKPRATPPSIGCYEYQP